MHASLPDDLPSMRLPRLLSLTIVTIIIMERYFFLLDPTSSHDYAIVIYYDHHHVMVHEGPLVQRHFCGNDLFFFCNYNVMPRSLLMAVFTLTEWRVDVDRVARPSTKSTNLLCRYLNTSEKFTSNRFMINQRSCPFNLIGDLQSRRKLKCIILLILLCKIRAIVFLSTIENFSLFYLSKMV